MLCDGGRLWLVGCCLVSVCVSWNHGNLYFKLPCVDASVLHRIYSSISLLVE